MIKSNRAKQLRQWNFQAIGNTPQGILTQPTIALLKSVQQRQQWRGLIAPMIYQM
jgi:hypothetical protein